MGIRLDDERRQHLMDVLELPDTRFVTYCYERYGLNRGIYNTIDEWLYSFGMKQVLARRQTLLGFLSSHHKEDRPHGTYLKFGKGGLTKLLQDYLTKSI